MTDARTQKLLDELRREVDLWRALDRALASPDPAALQQLLGRLRHEDSPAARLLIDVLKTGGLPLEGNVDA